MSMKLRLMAIIVVTGLFSLSAASQENYLGKKKSLIKWEEIEPDNWLSFQSWRKARDLKDQYPDWELKVRERRHHALMGRVLDCVGVCRIYKGEDFITANFRNTVYEGDELVTQTDSYLWVYLLDGTLVRLSPDSSVTMKELNIGEEENFIHARLNVGNIVWLSRSKHKHLENNKRETDALFLPLVFHQANPKEEKEDELSEDNLFAALEEDQTNLKQTQRLNQLIEENNKWIEERSTHSFLVMPNGTVFGESVQAEFIVLLGGESFIKQRGLAEQNLSGEEAPPMLNFYYRGFENNSEYPLKLSQWYQVDARGRSLSEYEAPSLFGMGEFITSRITSIRVAREMLLKRYSKFIYQDLDSSELARDHGHRKWGSLSQKEDDLARRLAFLKEHTRRTETSLLLVSSRFKEDIVEEKGELLESMKYSSRFFRKALVHYQRKKELEQVYDTGEGVLNSTKNPFWKIIHARRSSFSP